MKAQPLSLYKHILSIYLNLLEGRRMSNIIKTRTSEKAIEKSHLNGQTVTPPPPRIICRRCQALLFLFLTLSLTPILARGQNQPDDPPPPAPVIQPDPLPDAEGNLTLPGSDDPDNPNVYAQQNLRDGDLSFTLRRGTRIIVARETSSVGLAFLANNITAEIEAGAEIFSPDRAVLVFADNIVVNNRGDIEATGTDGGSESFSVDTTSAFRLNNFGRIESRTGTSINIGILATGVQIHNEKGGRIIGGRGINSDGISESFGRGSRVSVEKEGDGLAAQVFNRGVIQTGTGTPGAFAVDLRRFGGLLENLGEGQIIGGVRMIGNRARLFNDGSIDAGNQRHNLAIDFGASPGSRTRILASNNRPVLNPNDPIFNTSQTLEIGPHSQINGTIRFGAKAADPEDATTSVPDVLKFVARDADENGTQDPFIDMNLLVIDDFDLDKTAPASQSDGDGQRTP